MKLSPRQEQVAALVVQGMSNKAIGKALGLKTNTVEDHVFRIRRRLGGDGRARHRIMTWWFTERPQYPRN